MTAQDIAKLLNALSVDLNSPIQDSTGSGTTQTVAPDLLNDLKQAMKPGDTKSAVKEKRVPVLPGHMDFKYKESTLLPKTDQLLENSPAIFQGLRNNLKSTELITPIKGIGVLQAMNPIHANASLKDWFIKFSFNEFIAVYLAADTSTPVLLLPVHETIFTVLGGSTHYNIVAGSVWIHSSLFDNSTPANNYTGLTISSGTLSFTQSLSINSKKIIIPAGAGCNVLLNLQQPVDSTVSPDNIGVDAMNADVVLPTQFSFSFSGPKLQITVVSDASWNLYGSANTFQYDSSQPTGYNSVLNSILVPFKVTEPQFTVNNCGSPFFTIQGQAGIWEGYWELPLAVIDITKTNTASGIGAMAVACKPGLQVSWIGLKGGFVQLRFPILSAAPGIIGVADAFANNLYGKQAYNLWANEKTGFYSTLDVNYTNLFTVYYLSIQEGEELLATTAAFNANIDRPLRVNGSPVAVKGTNGLIYQVYTPTEKLFLLYDTQLLIQDYPTKPGAIAKYPQEALALTNALLTATPAASVLLYGTLDSPDTFKKALLYIGFGLYSLLPALPDPYASTYIIPVFGRGRHNDIDLHDVSELPLSDVVDLLICRVRWPFPVNSNPPLPLVSFAIVPLAGSNVFAAAPKNNEIAVAAKSVNKHAVAPSPGQVWDDRTGAFSGYDLAMLDVSTNADLMGVSFSTMNIRVNADGDQYGITAVDNSNDLSILRVIGMDLSTPGKFIRAFTLPEITWEPAYNLGNPKSGSGDPPPPIGWMLFGDDGGPTQLFNNSEKPVTIAPKPVSNFIVDTYNENKELQQPLVTASLFTLPYGIRAFALFNNAGKFVPGYVPPQLSIVSKDFDVTPTNIKNALTKLASGGLQITAEGQQDPSVTSNASFPGFSVQLRNVLDETGAVTNSSILGPDVDAIFNAKFAPVKKLGVPLERIDFSGYGASVFSEWLNPNADITTVSKAHFDAFVGRPSLEIVQVVSIVYPHAARFIRTITIPRSSSAFIFRADSGWVKQSDGIYDFSYHDDGGKKVDSPYEIHPGVVKGFFNITNIVENDLPQFKTSFVDGKGVTQQVLLQPVYHDADVQIDNLVQGAITGGGLPAKVPAKKMLAYVQILPVGMLIPKEVFDRLMASQNGALGVPVDCQINIGGSGQQMRLNNVQVSNSVDTSGSPVFAGVALGAPVLPKDGSWSIVQHNHHDDSVTPIVNNTAVPLIRIGKLKNDLSSDYPNNKLRFANPIDLLKAADKSTVDIGLLQNTGTQKVLFQLPAYRVGSTQLLSKDSDFPLAKFADAFHLVNSTGVFPNVGDVPDMDMTKYGINILDKGYQLLNKVNPAEMLKQTLPSPFYFVDTDDIKLSIAYDNGGADGNLNYDLGSAANNWLNSVKSMTLNVYLKPFIKPENPLVFITGSFDSSNGAASAYNTPVLNFGPDLKPIADILQILESLSTGDYAAVAKKAMDVAMGNSGDNFEYKFHADKEIATIQFPPAEFDGPTTPLRLTAGLKVGAYFNETVSITSDPSNLIPSAGAYFEFDGGMQVMCVSLAAATVYAVGQVAVRISADVKTGPALYLKFGFGVELMVGLPVVGNVSVTYMVGIEMDLTTTEIKITAFLLFKGEAQLIGGLVDITITIEASGTVDKRIGDAHTGSTTLTAQVTFAIDISIFLVINIDFSKSWSESRQIA
ncbi:MAG TPA: hypothetical protein VGN20_22900 [Mucilaginibacter sp.]|jgi:hypothetical protein